MAERGRANERKLEDFPADVGERGHAETRRQRARHHRKLAERIGADLLRVKFEVTAAVFEVTVCERIEVAIKVRAQTQRFRVAPRHELFAHRVGAGHEIDAVRRVLELKSGDVMPGGVPRQFLLNETPGDKPALIAGQRELYAVAEKRRRPRIPAACRVQKTSVACRHRGQGAEHAAMIERSVERGQRAAILDAQCAAPWCVDAPLAEISVASCGDHGSRLTVNQRG